MPATSRADQAFPALSKKKADPVTYSRLQHGKILVLKQDCDSESNNVLRLCEVSRRLLERWSSQKAPPWVTNLIERNTQNKRH